MRVLVRRERPHPGAQLDAFEERDGYRYQAIATNTAVGRLAMLDARHRAHTRVEDRIRTGKDTGIGRFPSRAMAINAAWLELALTAADLIAWTQTVLLDGELATAEPKALRYRLLHTAARITHGQRKTFLRLAAGWPWAKALARAFAGYGGSRYPPDRQPAPERIKDQGDTGHRVGAPPRPQPPGRTPTQRPPKTKPSKPAPAAY